LQPVRVSQVRIVFLIRALQGGGAERQLVTLIRGLDPTRFDVTVVTFYPGGALCADLEDLPNVRVVSADKQGRWDLLGFFVRLLRILHRAGPEVVHGYMYGANELALVFGRLTGAAVVWGIRASGLEMGHYDMATRMLYRSGAWLSRLSDLIIANSEAGRRFHLGIGYPPGKVRVIPNGIDTRRFAYNATERERVRRQWNTKDGEVLIGVVARLDPMKDHATFLRAAALASTEHPATRFVIVGAGDEQSLRILQSLASQLGVSARVLWAGPREDVAAVYSALDVFTCSSAFGEGFPNSLAEAMACERLCVATRVGDAESILGDCGEIVPPREPEALAGAWLRLLALSTADRVRRGQAARQRIVASFSVSSLVHATSELLTQVASRAAASMN
jgi:glycosyltransferase involved in cell wall biosynthesis